ncbi:hypothetical protein BH23CHL5_BH23CHL5_04670 [soil metagenome]
MKRLIVAITLVIVGLAFATGGALAQDSGSTDDSFMLRVGGDAIVADGDTVDAVVVINGDVTVGGTVSESLVVVSGKAIVNGTVGSDIVVIRGELELGPLAVVDDILLIRSDLTRADAATVTGDIEERSGDFSFGRGLAIFSILGWLGMMILGLVTAAIFAWLARDQLLGSIATLKADFVPSLITALLIWIVLPIVAVLILFTLIGAPLGISTLIVLLPVLYLLGLIIVGTWIGSYIIKPTTIGATIGAAVVGVLIAGLVSLIPFVAIVIGLAGLLGSGAFVYRAFRSAQATDNAVVPAAA